MPTMLLSGAEKRQARMRDDTDDHCLNTVEVAHSEAEVDADALTPSAFACGPEFPDDGLR
jgi:hypothetical protein